MRKVIEACLLVVATVAMFSFPVLMLGLTPWLGQGILSMTHVSVGRGLVSALTAIAVMLSGSGALMLLALPAFGALFWGLRAAIRAQSDPAPVRREAQPVTARDDDPPQPKVVIANPSRSMSTLRDLAPSAAAGQGSGHPGLPTLRSKRISTVRRSSDEDAPPRGR